MTAPSGLAIDVLGVDGSVWHLLDPFSPVQVVNASIVGLQLPTSTGQWSETAGLDGRRRRGRTVAGRDASFTVVVGDSYPPRRYDDAWRVLDDAWWTALGGGDEPFTLRVSTTGVDALGRPHVRTLQLWDESKDAGTSVDSALAGVARYEVAAAAETPWWSGPEVTARFAFNPGAEVDYYGGADGGGYGPPYYIGGGSQFAEAAITNPGQQLAWPRYRISAPFGSASVGLPGKVVPLPFGQVTSQAVVIDTDPRHRYIRSAEGDNLWPLIGPGVEPIFAPIEAGSSVPLSITLDRAELGAAVEVSLTPEYRRAW